MPRLPTSDDLGQRPVGISNPGSASFQGGGIGRAIAGFGQNVQQTSLQAIKVASAEDAKQDQYDLAVAKSALLSRQVKLEQGFNQDQDYTTFDARYRDSMEGAVKEIGSSLSPAAQKQFAVDAMNSSTSGIARINDLAFKKEGDAQRGVLTSLVEQNGQNYLQAPDDGLRSTLMTTTGQAIDNAAAKGYISQESAAKMKIDTVQNWSTARLQMLPPEEQLRLLAPKINSQSAAAAANFGPDMKDAIAAASAKHGVPVADLNQIAFLESSGNPNVPDNGDSVGPFQFQSATAKQYGLVDRRDPMQSADAAARLYKDNAAALKQTLGRDPSVGEVYLAHQQGIGGAQALLADPNRSALSALTDAYKGNEDKARAALTSNGGNVNMSAKDFADKWINKASAGGVARSGNWTDFVPAEKVPGIMDSARVYARAQLQLKVNDSTAMAQDGKVDPTPPSMDDFTLAFGQAEGALKFAQFQPVLQLGQDKAQMATMRPDDMSKLLESRKPVVGSDGYDAAQNRYQVLTQAAQQIATQRADDPVAFAQKYELMPMGAIDFSKADAMTNQLAERRAKVQQLTASYGTPPMLFTKTEAAQLTGMMQQMTPGQKLGYLKTLADGVKDPNVYRQTINQIRPDSPVTAMAGMYLGLNGSMEASKSGTPAITPASVAQNLVVGEDLLNPNKASKSENGSGKVFPMPQDQVKDGTGLRDIFNDYAGDAFRGNPQAADQAYQAMRAYYAATAAQAGVYDGKTNDNLASDAARAVVGGVTKINGGSVVRPWGMDETNFTDKAHMAFNQAIAANGYNPKVTTWGDSKLESNGNPGQYRVLIGSGYLMQQNGQPVTIDINRVQLSDGRAPSGMSPTQENYLFGARR